ncbi:hypothetical protein [Peribacillus simplex]|uniref:GntT/GntP/DsdX family permease n=1 Tax=Peribacillus simplex TaxID=1478 RepID=UPI000776B6D2|nr:hypothetical protein [Peribacillus simplex]
MPCLQKNELACLHLKNNYRPHGLCGVSFFTLGYTRRFNKEEINQFISACLAPTASIILIIGAGDAFENVLIMSGVVKPLQVKRLTLIFHRFCLVVMIQEATGSATVVMTAAAGSVLPIISSFPGVNFKLLLLAIGSSSLIPSHLNDEDLR